MNNACRKRDRERKKVTYQQNVLNGRCGPCGGARDASTVYCSGCLRKHAVKQHAVYARRLAKTCCHRCGEPLGDAQGKSCIKCILKSVARKRLDDESRWVDLLNLYNQQERRCAISGEKLVFGLNASLDHKQATSRGGTHDLQNLQWVTKQVNDAKGARSEAELIEMCRLILEYQQEKQKNNGS